VSRRARQEHRSRSARTRTIAIIDTGGFGYRPLLVKRLAERGLKPPT